MTIFLSGLAIGGYRSFGPRVQRMGPFAKINLFVGANNSGKSNILRLINQHLRKITGKQPSSPEFTPGLDLFRPHRCPLTVGIGCLMSHPQLMEAANTLQQYHRRIFDKLPRSSPMTYETPCVWFDYTLHENNATMNSIDRTAKLLDELSNNEWQSLAQTFFPQISFGSREDRIRYTLSKIDVMRCPLPPSYLVPAVRHIDDASWGIKEIGGNNVIEELASFQHPAWDRQEQKQKFHSIVHFVQEVTGCPTARIEIPSPPNDVYVQINGSPLPLKSLGTGIHEVVILAAAATMVAESIICLEEPELHLHPILQRKLLQYLSQHTSNQYFITSHSAHLIDAMDAACFRVRIENGETIVETAAAVGNRLAICRDLGYKASDLLQSNYVIWVEGPSDRLYLRHWINALDSTLIEGIHYSIMFYGGRLLCHLSVDDEEVTDFIQLCKLNRNLAILIDSDKDEEATELNDTKARICKELDGRGLAWVTAGRAIENYIPGKLLRECVEAVRPGRGGAVQTERFDRAVPYTTENSTTYVDKMKIANQVIAHPADLSAYDLNSRIEELVGLIRGANQ